MQGKFAESEQLQREVLLTKRRVLGDAHPETVTAEGNYAVALIGIGDLDAAELRGLGPELRELVDELRIGAASK
jgi:hypothetical protein